MDERKVFIRELEEKKRAQTEARRRLLEEFGETLLYRIGDGPFGEDGNGVSAEDGAPSGETFGGILADCRKLQGEIEESARIIKNLEAETLRLKDLEAGIAAKEGEKSRLEKGLSELQAQLGRALLLAPGSGDFVGPVKQREELLLAKIEERENKMDGLEDKEGGVLEWLRKNAQMAVSKTLLTKDRAALERLYLDAGEKMLSAETAAPDAGTAGGPQAPETAELLEKARELKASASSLAGELAGLKAERRKIIDLFGAEGSPSRRIQAQEKHIAYTRGEFPAVRLRFGSLAAADPKNEALAAVLKEEDRAVFEQAELLRAGIAEKELAIGKVQAALNIDGENAEIEKARNGIESQRRKIAAAEKAIGDLETRIAESELRIAELNDFLRKNP